MVPQLQQTQSISTTSSTVSTTGSTTTNGGKVSLTLELTSSNKSSRNDDIGTVRRIELNDGGIRLILTLPKIIDGEQANLMAALLFEHIDRLPNTAVVERIKLSGLQFTDEGVIGLKGFLSLHAATVKHVSLKEILTGEDYSPEQAKAFASLAKVFELSTKLETLNLSDNTIDASLWENFSCHTNLRQLILDYVYMNDQSLIELKNNFTFGNTLEELYVVLTNTVGPAGLDASNQILPLCKRVSSLRWAVREAPADALLPWKGLHAMAQGGEVASTSTRSVSTNKSQSKLIHLVMDGGTINNEEMDCLANALTYLDQLRTIKLRGIGLKDQGATMIAQSLLTSQPTVEILDLSRNNISASGSVALSKICDVDTIVKNLSTFSLEKNNIDAGGARTLLEEFGSKANPKLELKLDANPFHYGKVAFNLACRKAQAETERDELLRDIAHLQQSNNNNNNNGSTNINAVNNNKKIITDELKLLQDEVRRLRDEKTTLMNAFAIVGTTNHIQEYTRMMERMTQLEMMVHNNTNPARQPSYEMSASASVARRPSYESFTINSTHSSNNNNNNNSSSNNNNNRNNNYNNTPIIMAPKTPRRGAGGGGGSSDWGGYNQQPDSPGRYGSPTPQRRTMMLAGRDNNNNNSNMISPLQHNPNNMLLRGSSERWGLSATMTKSASTSTVCTTSTSKTSSSSSSQSGSNNNNSNSSRYASPPKKGRGGGTNNVKMDIIGSDSVKQSARRNASNNINSSRQRSLRDIHCNPPIYTNDVYQ